MSKKIDFSQYHDENGVFYKEFKLTFGQCDRNSKLTLAQLLLLTSDTAVEDYHQLGYTWDFLCQQHLYILLSRISFHILKMPVTNQFITIKTWEDKPDGIQLNRAYKIFDTNTKELLISGYSTWTVVNTETRRIIPAKHFTLRPAPVTVSEYDGRPIGKIPIPENTVPLDTRKIRFSDIDANSHTNNSRYGNFIMDALPENLQDGDFEHIRINYSQEAVLGETLELSAAFNGKETVVVGKQNNVTCFECILVER